ncbi:MAG: hypothetical protein ABI970_22020 [Chloroflexota bacterium]
MPYVKAHNPATQLPLLPGLQTPTRYWLLPPSVAGCRASEFAAKPSKQHDEAANANLPLLPDLLTVSVVGEHLRVLPVFHPELSLFPSFQLRHQFHTD